MIIKEAGCEKFYEGDAVISNKHCNFFVNNGNANSTDIENLIDKVKQTVANEGFCVVVASEGTRYKNGMFLADSGLTDAFGHKQLGGVAPVLAQMISSIGLKNHWAVSDYLQRSARHISSKTDLDQAYAVGKKAVEFALGGKNAVMPVIKRLSNKPYKWKIESASLSKVANVEKTLPKSYISKDGFMISSKGIDYLTPLIQGEPPLEFKNGIPVVAKLKNVLVKKLT